MSGFLIRAERTPTLPGRFTAYVVHPDGEEWPVGYAYLDEVDALRHADAYRWHHEALAGVPEHLRSGRKQERVLIVRVDGEVDEEQDDYPPSATQWTRQNDEDDMREMLR